MRFSGSNCRVIHMPGADHWVTAEGRGDVFIDLLFPVAGLHCIFKKLCLGYVIREKGEKMLRFILRRQCDFIFILVFPICWFISMAHC